MISDAELATFRMDGVVKLRGLMDACERRVLCRAMERRLVQPALSFIADSGGRRFVVEGGLWVKDDDFLNVIGRSPLVEVARLIVDSRQKLNLLDDQLFVKESGASDPTPWHHDVTFWPFEGKQLASIWVALDDVGHQSGALRFMRGSHKWARRFKAMGVFRDPAMLDPEHEDVPEAADAEVVQFELQAGDALAFSAMTVHGADGNLSHHSRRAYVTRWGGDDVVYAPRRYASPRHLALAQAVNLIPGAPLDSAAYPVIWWAVGAGKL